MNTVQQVNKAKLRSLGLAKVYRACVIHVKRASKLAARGDKGPRYQRHCDLLDQCNEVGRQLLKEARENGEPLPFK